MRASSNPLVERCSDAPLQPCQLLGLLKLMGASVREVNHCAMDYVSKETLTGVDLELAEYAHVIDMRSYRADPARASVLDPQLTEWCRCNCTGGSAFLLVFEIDAYRDSDILCSYRMAFMDDRDAMLFKLSEWFS